MRVIRWLERPPLWFRVGAALLHLVLLVAAPVLGFVMLCLDFAEGPEIFTGEALEFGMFFGLMLGPAVLLSGVSLHWTLWGRAPAFVRYYTASWVVVYVLLMIPVCFLLAMAAGSHPPGIVMFVGGMLAMPTPICLLASTLIAFMPGVVLAIVMRGSDRSA